MTSHINRLKSWNAPDASMLRVVLTDEDNVQEEKGEPDWKVLLTTPQHTDIEQLLVDYKYQNSGKLGKGIGLLHTLTPKDMIPLRHKTHENARIHLYIARFTCLSDLCWEWSGKVQSSNGKGKGWSD